MIFVLSWGRKGRLITRWLKLADCLGSTPLGQWSTTLWKVQFPVHHTLLHSLRYKFFFVSYNFIKLCDQYSQNITHTTSCPSNLTVAVECSPYSKCSAHSSSLVDRHQQQLSVIGTNDTEALNVSPSVAIEVPEEVVPTLLYISALNGTSVRCMAYAVGSNWLITSGLCLK